MRAIAQWTWLWPANKNGWFPPNPCSSQICISTNVPTSSGTAISITNVDGTLHKSIPVKEGETQIEVSTADFPEGRYFVSLVVDGNVISNKQIVKL